MKRLWWEILWIYCRTKNSLHRFRVRLLRQQCSALTKSGQPCTAYGYGVIVLGSALGKNEYMRLCDGHMGLILSRGFQIIKLDLKDGTSLTL